MTQKVQVCPPHYWLVVDLTDGKKRLTCYRCELVRTQEAEVDPQAVWPKRRVNEYHNRAKRQKEES